MSTITLFIIVGAVIVLFGIGAWWLMRARSANVVSITAKKFFAKPPTHPVIIIGEDHVARLREFVIPLPTFLINTAKDGMWHQVSSLMLPLQGMIRQVQILNERCTVPYNPFVKPSPTKLAKITNLDAIADEGGRNAVRDGIKNSKNNMIASALVICACAIAFVFLLFIGFQFWQNGGINFGGGA